MTAGVAVSPKYNPALVERAILEKAIELHPQLLTVDELSLKIAADPDDSSEVEVATQAIQDLRRSGLLRYRSDDQIVEPTHAAFRAFALLSD